MQWMKALRNYPDMRRRFDMSSNGCSVKGAKKYLPDDLVDNFARIFRKSCVIHDFGYRNFGPGELGLQRKYLNGKQKQWGAIGLREYIDRRFLVTMDRTCARRDRPGGPDDGHWDWCDRAAEAFYIVVRNFGDDAWNNG